jgi:hypothetical protein
MSTLKLNNNTFMKNGVVFNIPNEQPFPNFIKGISLKNMSNNFDAFLRTYRSPDNEESIAKNIPMYLLGLYYAFGKLNGSWRIKYRGPSIPGIYNRDQSHCIKQHATSFAIYKR